MTNLIPQKYPFVMIDQLDYSDETTTRCTLTVRESNLFFVDERLREPGLIESIAQTAAARAGYMAMMEDKPVPLGFIGAIKDLEILDLPRLGDVLATEIKLINQVFGVSIITGTIRLAEKLLAHCEMKIIVKPEI